MNNPKVAYILRKTTIKGPTMISTIGKRDQIGYFLKRQKMEDNEQDETASKCSEKSRQVTHTRRFTSSFLSPTRKQIEDAKFKVNEYKPGVGRYTINYKRVDSEKYKPNPFAELSPAFLSTVRVEPGDMNKTGRGWLTTRSNSTDTKRIQSQNNNTLIIEDQF
ncbi:MAG: hypothetical protein EZS28_004852 [Streblomastix strix]|uniref:Uncharacterized protein n=1 Tax=Streblomastix strix TaxID=222440 RepID=A0A5J4WZ53_9EUKA|nr:MAG: hypothetical protein EZS28_004852 [Streblomastix strix]